MFLKLKCLKKANKINFRTVEFEGKMWHFLLLLPFKSRYLREKPRYHIRMPLTHYPSFKNNFKALT